MNGPEKQHYRGRFAPSPTGPLHFGSLVAAVGSYLRARALDGSWFVRIEDIDPPREVAGASDLILATLETFGLLWDDSVAFQSARSEFYDAALEDLLGRELAYPCSCTRKEILAHNLDRLGQANTVYPGLCRTGPLNPDRQRRAIRIRVPEEKIAFTDGEAGRFAQALTTDCGDFVLRRRDGFYAYQLAVVVDDAEQRITEVVRGQDLLDSTPGQIFLQGTLGLPTPDYLHLPVVTTAEGKKLSKQTGAQPLDPQRAPQMLHKALLFLGFPAPRELAEAPPADQLLWATSRWKDRRTRDIPGAEDDANPLESGQ